MGLLEASLHAGDLTDLSAQAHLADDHDVVPKLSAGGRRDHGERQWKVGGRLSHVYATHHRGVHVQGPEVDAGATLQHGQQEGQPSRIQAARRPARMLRRGPHDQRLDLHQQRTVALQGRQHDRAGNIGGTVGQEQPAGVVHRPQPIASHLEQADLVAASEPVLDHPQHSQGVVAITRQLQDRVDYVLQELRPCQGTILGDVADQKGRHAPGLRLDHQALGASTDLAGRAGGSSISRQVHRLDGVHDEEVGLQAIGVGQDRLHRCVAGQPEVVQHCAQAVGPEPDLGCRLLGAHQQDASARPNPGGGQLQGEGRLADPGLATQERHRARDQATVEAPVSLGHAGGHCGCRPGFQRRHRLHVAQLRHPGNRRTGLEQRVPGRTRGTAAHPLRMGRGTRSAGVRVGASGGPCRHGPNAMDGV